MFEARDCQMFTWHLLSKLPFVLSLALIRPACPAYPTCLNCPFPSKMLLSWTLPLFQPCVCSLHPQNDHSSFPTSWLHGPASLHYLDSGSVCSLPAGLFGVANKHSRTHSVDCEILFITEYLSKEDGPNAYAVPATRHPFLDHPIHRLGRASSAGNDCCLSFANNPPATLFCSPSSDAQ